MLESRLFIAEKYREIAAGCEIKAAKMADPILRNYFLKLAGNWRGLADKSRSKKFMIQG